MFFRKSKNYQVFSKDFYNLTQFVAWHRRLKDRKEYKWNLEFIDRETKESFYLCFTIKAPYFKCFIKKNDKTIYEDYVMLTIKEWNRHMENYSSIKEKENIIKVITKNLNNINRKILEENNIHYDAFELPIYV